MIFQCNESHICGNKTWSGTIRLLCHTATYYEAVAEARGTCFYLIAGSYQNGNYLCVPNHRIGCDLAQYTDLFWNREQISRFLNPVDTESLVCAVSQLPKFKESN